MIFDLNESECILFVVRSCSLHLLYASRITVPGRVRQMHGMLPFECLEMALLLLLFDDAVIRTIELL